MDLHTLARRFAARSGLSWREGRDFISLFFAELADQLALGEDVSIPNIGRLKVVVVKPSARTSNLPAAGMLGKKVLSASHQEISFKPYPTWNDFVRGQKGLRALVRFAADPDVKCEERRLIVGKKKKKKQKEIVIHVPEGVTSIRIDLGPDAKLKKEGSKSKRKLLG